MDEFTVRENASQRNQTDLTEAKEELCLQDSVLRVSEVFESLQGEGTNIGSPSTFLRLALCNLRCVWCDTKYTWDWKRFTFEDEVRGMSTTEVLAALRASRSTNIVITGGEPLLQQRQLLPVLRELTPDHTFEVETASTILPEEGLIALVTQWNVSPKLANSGNSFPARHKPAVLKRFAELGNAIFKFVLQSEGDLDEVLSIVREFHVPSQRVLLMPEATEALDMNEKCQWLAKICLEHKFRLGYRLHVAIWGNKRGV